MWWWLKEVLLQSRLVCWQVRENRSKSELGGKGDKEENGFGPGRRQVWWQQHLLNPISFPDLIPCLGLHRSAQPISLAQVCVDPSEDYHCVREQISFTQRWLLGLPLEDAVHVLIVQFHQKGGGGGKGIALWYKATIQYTLFWVCLLLSTAP